MIFGGGGGGGGRGIRPLEEEKKNACRFKGFFKRIQHQRESELGGTLTDTLNYSLPCTV